MTSSLKNTRFWCSLLEGNIWILSIATCRRALAQWNGSLCKCWPQENSLESRCCLDGFAKYYKAGLGARSNSSSRAAAAPTSATDLLWDHVIFYLLASVSISVKSREMVFSFISSLGCLDENHRTETKHFCIDVWWHTISRFSLVFLEMPG